MARKSRKAPLQIKVDNTVAENRESVERVESSCEENVLLFPEEHISKKKYMTAAYIRLSLENNGHENDTSIQSQISLVEGFILEKSDMQLVDTFVDNGVSGTRFDRPEFVRMMEAVKRGQINCIVVKDLSRFGRDYLEAGYYIETVFPLLNVRFIAITDHFDSKREEDRNSLSVPIKNMVNAMYAKDYSRKQEVFRNMCIKSGRVMGLNSLYGYNFDKTTKRLVMDMEVAPYVRMVFAWILAGVSKAEIARRMNQIGAPTPSEIDGWPEKIPWSSDTITNIIYNPAYAGFHVMGKSKTSIYRGIKTLNCERDQWIYFPDYHTPYITMDEYDTITNMFKKNKRIKDEREKAGEGDRLRLPDFFPKKVWCANCNRQMMFIRGSHHRGYRNLSFGYYRCKSAKKTGKCNNIHIQGNYLQMIVTDQIRMLLQVACEKKKLLQAVEKKTSKNDALSTQRKLGRLRSKESRLEEKMMQLYTDYAEKLLDESEYMIVRKRLLDEQTEIQCRIQEEEKKSLELECTIASFKEFAAHIDEYMSQTELTPELADELIERIRIYDDGERIEIVFKCQDMMNNQLFEDYLRGGLIE